MRVTLVGPCHPGDIAATPLTSDVPVDGEFRGYRGVPVSDLAAALWSRGHQVTVVTTSHHPHAVNYLGDRLEVRTVPMRPRARDRALDMFRLERTQLAREISRSDADVVHAHWTYEFALAALAGSRPVVVTAHDAPLTILRHMPHPYRVARAVMAGWARTRIKHLTAVSPYLAEQWRRQLGYRKRIAVVPNAVEVPVSLPHKPATGRVRFLDVADSSRWKNVTTLVSAFAQLRSKRDDVDLGLVGPGLGETDELASWARREGLDRSVNFGGALGRAELIAEYASSDIFVHTSIEEACPMAVLEAMAAQLPVIGGFRSGGVPWVLDNGRAGLLVDVRRADDVARAMDALATNVAQRAQLARAASDRAREFSVSNMVDAYRAEYDRALAG